MASLPTIDSLHLKLGKSRAWWESSVWFVYKDSLVSMRWDGVCWGADWERDKQLLLLLTWDLLCLNQRWLQHSTHLHHFLCSHLQLCVKNNDTVVRAAAQLAQHSPTPFVWMFNNIRKPHPKKQQKKNLISQLSWQNHKYFFYYYIQVHPSYRLRKLMNGWKS